MKLTIPLARSRNAGTQRTIAGRVNNRDKINTIEENKSIALKISPVKTNIPFNKSNPAQNKTN